MHAVLCRGRLEKRLHALRRATNKHTGRCPLRVSLSAPLVRPSAWRCEARLRTSSSAARARQSRRSAPKLLTAAAALPACPWTADATAAHKHTNTQTNKPPRRHRCEARRKAPAHDCAHVGAWARRVQRVKPARARPAQCGAPSLRQSHGGGSEAETRQQHLAEVKVDPAEEDQVDRHFRRPFPLHRLLQRERVERQAAARPVGRPACAAPHTHADRAEGSVRCGARAVECSQVAARAAIRRELARGEGCASGRAAASAVGTAGSLGWAHRREPR